jgi:hypothetical protein
MKPLDHSIGNPSVLRQQIQVGQNRLCGNILFLKELAKQGIAPNIIAKSGSLAEKFGLNAAD